MYCKYTFFSYSGIVCVFFNIQVGDNGAGKTTLLKIIMGILSPVAGMRHVHRNLKFGYFSQHHVDQLDMNVNSVELLQSAYPGILCPPQIRRSLINTLLTGQSVEEYRRQLGSFGVSGDLALQTVASLSGGQKSRVAFARMCMGRPNFLVLDEPTNHLDIETIEVLGNAITKYTVYLEINEIHDIRNQKALTRQR